MGETTVIQIIAEGLKARGFDGLVQPDSECGCLAASLAPCGESPTNCHPGYRGMSAEFPGEWSIFRSKAAAEESKLATTPQGDEP